MGIRVIGRANGATIRLRPVGSNTQGGDGKPALGGDVDGSEHVANGADNGDEPGASVAAGFIDTATLGTDSSGDAPYGYTPTGRRRNRPTGSNSGKRSSAGSTTQTTDDIAGYLASAHLLAANLLKMPQFKLSDDESKKLAEATVRVTNCYDMGIGTEEQRAWINLALVASSIYIPKVFGGPVIEGNKPKQENKPQAPSEPLPTWMN